MINLRRIPSQQSQNDKTITGQTDVFNESFNPAGAGKNDQILIQDGQASSEINQLTQNLFNQMQLIGQIEEMQEATKIQQIKIMNKLLVPGEQNQKNEDKQP